mmetsp:Transcript_3488/g.7620  ORF Transcript_3488/g.7620 Transcript_3488/m.7620 type:complete len:278 (-) Transcript_3488:1034-1867(-)
MLYSHVVFCCVVFFLLCNVQFHTVVVPPYQNRSARTTKGMLLPSHVNRLGTNLRLRIAAGCWRGAAASGPAAPIDSRSTSLASGVVVLEVSLKAATTSSEPTPSASDRVVDSSSICRLEVSDIESLIAAAADESTSESVILPSVSARLSLRSLRCRWRPRWVLILRLQFVPPPLLLALLLSLCRIRRSTRTDATILCLLRVVPWMLLSLPMPSASCEGPDRLLFQKKRQLQASLRAVLKRKSVTKKHASAKAMMLRINIPHASIRRGTSSRCKTSAT